MELRTRYGKLSGCTRVEYDGGGNVTGCCFDRKNKIETGCGTFIPQYGEETVRKKYTQAVSFYKSGALRRVALEKQATVQTPAGPFPAELVLFYESGAVRRIFPLNGRLSGYWSQEDEAKLAAPLFFSFPFGSFRAKITGIHFYENGAVRSVSLFPGEEISLRTPAGTIAVRKGFSLYEDGALQSVEPARPVPVDTQAGRIEAFDDSAVLLEADSNSLKFSKSGEITAVTASGQNFLVQNRDGPPELIEPLEKPHPLADGKTVLLPISICFLAGAVTIKAEKTHVYTLPSVRVTAVKRAGQGCGSCEGCSGCEGCRSGFPNEL